MGSHKACTTQERMQDLISVGSVKEGIELILGLIKVVLVQVSFEESRQDEQVGYLKSRTPVKQRKQIIATESKDGPELQSLDFPKVH